MMIRAPAGAPLDELEWQAGRRLDGEDDRRDWRREVFANQLQLGRSLLRPCPGEERDGVLPCLSGHALSVKLLRGPHRLTSPTATSTARRLRLARDGHVGRGDDCAAAGLICINLGSSLSGCLPCCAEVGGKGNVPARAKGRR